MRYDCPNAVRARGFPPLLCRALLKDGTIPAQTMERAACCCAHQYFCPQTQNWENTMEAGKCIQMIKEGGEIP